MNPWKSWKYKNLTILICSFVLAFFLGSFGPFHSFLFRIGTPAAALAGIIFISTFTVPVAAVMLLVLAEKFPLLELWIIASIGAILTDFLFFRLSRDGLGKEIEPLYDAVAGSHFHKVLKTQHFRWIFPVLGAIIILSPFPKVPGFHLLGIPRLKNQEFIALSTALNVLGIAFILFLSFFIKP